MYSIKYFLNNFDTLKEKLQLRRNLLISENDWIKSKEKAQQVRKLDRLLLELHLNRKKITNSDDIESIKKIGREIKECTHLKSNLENELFTFIHQLPNIPDDDLTDKFKLIEEWGIKNKYEYSLKSHKELGQLNNLFSSELGALLSGSGYVIYTNFGAELYRALIKFTLDCNIAAGYQEYFLPVVVSDEVLFGTSQLPKFKDDLFSISENKYLSPTSEAQLVNLYRGKIIECKELPIKMTANTNCFRKEAGAHGKDTTGIIRLHQFSKTEIVVICDENESNDYLWKMTKHACSILKELQLPYRVIQLSYDDMSFSASKTYDIEVWFPSEESYREISSVSNTLDFQSRRAGIRCKNRIYDKSEKSRYPHILNGSSLAIDRLFAAILDNYQTEDGSIEIPEVLKTYISFTKISKKV